MRVEEHHRSRVVCVSVPEVKTEARVNLVEGVLEAIFIQYHFHFHKAREPPYSPS